MDENPTATAQTRPSFSMKLLGLMSIVVLGPICVACSALAGAFILQEFVNGLIPTRWISTSIADWLFGTGATGSAQNYIGFMVSALPASLSAAGVRWGYEKVKPAKK